MLKIQPPQDVRLAHQGNIPLLERPLALVVLPVITLLLVQASVPLVHLDIILLVQLAPVSFVLLVTILQTQQQLLVQLAPLELTHLPLVLLLVHPVMQASTLQLLVPLLVSIVLLAHTVVVGPLYVCHVVLDIILLQLAQQVVQLVLQAPTHCPAHPRALLVALGITHLPLLLLLALLVLLVNTAQLDPLLA